MKIRLTWAVPLGIVVLAAIAVFAVYGTHAFTVAGRLAETVF
ncbi:hypothetical protein ACFU6I_06885 [Streptomyces sp. NPDC057486]